MIASPELGGEFSTEVIEAGTGARAVSGYLVCCAHVDGIDGTGQGVADNANEYGRGGILDVDRFEITSSLLPQASVKIHLRIMVESQAEPEPCSE